jgi:hypothetical protein
MKGKIFNKKKVLVIKYRIYQEGGVFYPEKRVFGIWTKFNERVYDERENSHFNQIAYFYSKEEAEKFLDKKALPKSEIHKYQY